MAGLADTVARLAKSRRLAPGIARSGAAKMVAVADFGPNPGGLRMLSYRPAGLANGAPLVVVLHGCGQDGEAFAGQAGWLTLADRLGFAVLAPEQSASNNFNRCFNWFEPADIAREQGEAASIAAMVRHAIAEGADPGRVYVSGLSAGGAMAVVMLGAYPELFTAGAVVAGLPYGVADGVSGAFSAMRGGSGPSTGTLADRLRTAAPAADAVPRLIIWQGDADQTVAASNAVALLDQWAALHGLDAGDAEVERMPGLTRLRLRAPGGDRVLLESNLVHGLGHGTPLLTTGDEALGEAAPYMLEAGVSSSLETARFWGLAPPEATDRTLTRPRAVKAPPRSRTAPKPSAVPHAHGLGDQVMSAVSPHVSPAVRTIVEKALQAAGLKA